MAGSVRLRTMVSLYVCICVVSGRIVTQGQVGLHVWSGLKF
jgi:hypothetical protein